MRALWISVLMLGLFGVARADTSEYESEQLARYQKFAGAPVDDFLMFKLYQWQVVGADKVVAWSTIRDAYLITVAQPCVRLEWTHALGLTTAQMRKVSKNFDFVAFENQRCKITEIRPIDLAAMHKEKTDQTANSADKP